MPFPSTKTKEQLVEESKKKSENIIVKAAGQLEKVARKRDTATELKTHLKEISDDLRSLAKEVGKT